MTTFYLIRHAERAGDQRSLVGRTPGVHLSEAGQAQARRLAEYLAAEPMDAILSSPMERTRETAAPLAQRKGITFDVCTAINEIESGEWTGRRFPELDASDERWRRFNHFRSSTPIPGGETVPEIQARFVGEMLRLRAKYPNGSVALVSHADPIKIALAYFLGAPADLYDRIEIGLASVSVVVVDEWSANVTKLNHQASSGAGGLAKDAR